MSSKLDEAGRWSNLKDQESVEMGRRVQMRARRFVLETKEPLTRYITDQLRAPEQVSQKVVSVF